MFFSYRPTLGAFAAGIVAATMIGIAGGLMPAIRASRMEIISAHGFKSYRFREA
jgi:ABC-type antimicrobial peptide transport system permease subunit